MRRPRVSLFTRFLVKIVEWWFMLTMSKEKKHALGDALLKKLDIKIKPRE